MSNSNKRDQISVALDPQLRAAVERTAAEQCRTVSGQIRYFVAKAVEQQQSSRQVAA